MLRAAHGFGSMLPFLVAGCAQRPASPPPSDAAPLSAWIELGDGGVILARAITTGACPVLVAEGIRLPLRTRAEASDGYAVRSCEIEVPAGATNVTVGPIALRAPVTPRSIVVLGDTGCRMKVKAGKGRFQACNDGDAWPFAKLAARAAALSPDLVVHVGDYFYREAACPPNEAGCTGAPWGYGWDAWNADFFTPAAALLRAAPWVMVRGDHERCDRASVGWFRFLDPGPVPTGCPSATPARAVTLGGLTLVAIDTAVTPDDPPKPADVEIAKRQLAEANAKAKGETWLLAHAPLWAVWNEDERGPKTTTETLQAASGNTFPPAISTIVSGHLHRFQLLSYGAARPVQLIAGHGGSKLDAAKLADYGGRELMGATVSTWRDRLEPGFVLLEAEEGGWKATTYDANGPSGLICHLRGREARCAP